jgi:regulator of nucleoside diphosphate kinase
MKPRTIYITELDMKRLLPLVERNRDTRTDLTSFEAELRRAQVVDSRQVPPDVVTMNSRVRVRDLEDGEETVYTLVFPDQASIEENRISVLAPVGTAMLGQRVGDEVEWEVPAGKVRLQVVEIIFQPEAAGQFNL